MREDLFEWKEKRYWHFRFPFQKNEAHFDEAFFFDELVEAGEAAPCGANSSGMRSSQRQET